MQKSCLSLFLVIVFSACATTGYFKGVPLDGIEVGSTTEKEVKALFGPPNDQEMHDSFSGSETMTYRNVKVTKVGSNRNLSAYSGEVNAAKRKLHKKLQFWFDKEGVVTDFELQQRRERPGVR